MAGTKTKKTERIDEFELEVSAIVRDLPSELDPEWLLAVYLSLSTAVKLGYKEDSHAKLARKIRDEINSEILSNGALTISAPSERTKSWLAGHFFNNALFRMVALAEITLNDLFKREMNMDPPYQRYEWLAEWYEKKYSRKLDQLGQARKRVNTFKHKPRPTDAERTSSKSKQRAKFDKPKDAARAFRQLIDLMTVLNETSKT